MTTYILPVSIKEGQIARAQKDQEIDYHHLNSCFTLTVQFLNGDKIGAHFALFGKEADGGRSPKELLSIFSKAMEQATLQGNPPASLNLVGFLGYWYPSKLGLKQSQEGTLSESRSQKTLADYLRVPVENIQVKDTSFKDHVYLTIAADGSVIFKEKDDDKDKR